MEVLEHRKAFIEEDDDPDISQTKSILTNGTQFFHTRADHHRKSEISPLTFEAVPIPNSQIWSTLPAGLTRAPESLPRNTYIKLPSLLCFDDTDASADIHMTSILLHEAQICEILRNCPHPNIAKYLGCIIVDDSLTGLCFKRYGSDLHERVEEGPPFNRASCLESIRKEIEHLHGLGIIHYNIKPSNILSDGDDFVVADFDSCTMEGDELGLKAGTIDWTNEDFSVAERENDFYGLAKIEEYLYRETM